MVSLNSLPPELKTNIISFIDSSKCLAALNQTSRQLQELTETALYESVFITYRKDVPFQKAVKAKPKRKDLIKELRVNCEAERMETDRFTSACAYADLYGEFQNLETLELTSLYWSWFDEEYDRSKIEPEDIVDWKRFQDTLAARLDRASLAKPPEARTWTNLKSCTLDFHESSGQGWFLHDFSPAMFLIASLEELVLKKCRLIPTDGAGLPNSPFRGQTALRTLCLEETYIHHRAVENILCAPRALTSLHLGHRGDQWPGNDRVPDTDTPVTVDRELWMQILGQQKHSLEFLNISEQMCDELLCENENDFRDFTALKRVDYDGMVYHVTDEEVEESEREQCFDLDGGRRYRMEYRMHRSEMYAIGLAG